jgi:hypothetical protein
VLNVRCRPPCCIPLKELGDCYGLMTLNFTFEDNKRGLD